MLIPPGFLIRIHDGFHNSLGDVGTEANLLCQNICRKFAAKLYKETGDEYVVEILQEICGEQGAVFRYGGEEFAVIFRADHKTAERTMQTALERFSAVKFDFTDQVITFSYGSAEYNCMESSVELFDRADRIMYERKRALHKRENSARAKTAESGRRKKHAAQDSRFSPEAELQAAE